MINNGKQHILAETQQRLNKVWRAKTRDISNGTTPGSTVTSYSYTTATKTNNLNIDTINII